MLQAIFRTITEMLDSKKAAYSFIAVIGASVLYLYFKVSIEDALLLVSPLGVATLSQAHVDAASVKAEAVVAASVARAETTAPVVPAAPVVPTVPAAPTVPDAGPA